MDSVLRPSSTATPLVEVQTDRQTDTKTDTQTDMQTDRQTDRQILFDEAGPNMATLARL